MPKEITVEELKAKIDAKADIILVDVREKDEYELCRIEGSVLMPLSEFEDRIGELGKNKEILIHCHHGGRSMRACLFLEDQGYENVANVAGGINAWSFKIDNKVPRY